MHLFSAFRTLWTWHSLLFCPLFYQHFRQLRPESLSQFEHFQLQFIPRGIWMFALPRHRFLKQCRHLFLSFLQQLRLC